MSEQLGPILWEIGVFVVPAAVIFGAAVRITVDRRGKNQPWPKLNGWIIAAAVVIAGPIVAATAAAVTSWSAGFGAYGIMMWSGIALLLLAGLALGLVRPRMAGFTMVTMAIGLPLIVAATGSAWVIDDNAGEPTPESVFLATLAVTVLFSLPALISGILLLSGSRPDDRGGNTTSPRPDEPSETQIHHAAG